MHVRHWRRIRGLTLGGFHSTTCAAFRLENRFLQAWRIFDLLATRRVLRLSVPVSVGRNPHPHDGPTEEHWWLSCVVAQISLLTLSFSHPYPTEPLPATCCMSHRCRKHFLCDSLWGWNESKWFGKAARGVWRPGGPCPQRELRAELRSSPALDRLRVPAADPGSAPGPRVTLCHATQHLDQEMAVACCVIFLKAHFPVQGGSRWKAEPLKGRYFERPHRQFSNKRASKAGIYPKLSNWPSLLIWDLMPPNQTNSKSHLLNFSAQCFF